MANIQQLFGVNRSVLTDSGYTDKQYLYSHFGGSVYDVLTNTGTNINVGEDFYGTSDITIDADSTFEIYNDKLIHSNLYGPNRMIDLEDSTYTWTDIGNKMPYCKFLKSWNSRLYGGYCRLPVMDIKKWIANIGAVYKLEKLDLVNPIFKNRVFYTDLPKADKKIIWGLDYGSWIFYTGSTYNLIFNHLMNFSHMPSFKDNNLKVGDPFFVYDNTKTPPYQQCTIEEIITENSLNLTSPGIQVGLSSVSVWSAYEAMPWWAGSNWFDIPENDEITGLENTKESLLCFCKNSLYSYNISSLRKVANIGCTSPKSIKTIGNLTIFFHGSTKEKTGFYIYNGVDVKKVSQKVQPFMDGISTDNYDDVVGWTEGNTYRAYIGDLSNVNSSDNAFNVSMNKAVFTLDLANTNMLVEPIAHTITASGELEDDNQIKTYIGDSDSEVMETPSGNDFNGTSISTYIELGPIFPRGTNTVNKFTRVRLLTRDAINFNVKYKLLGNLESIDEEWQSLGTIKNDSTELQFNSESKGLGIMLRIDHFGKTESNAQLYEIGIGSEFVSGMSPEINKV